LSSDRRSQTTSLVAVDDADDDDDAHARDGRDGQRQPAVLEAPGDDVAQEYRSRVLVVGRVVVRTTRVARDRAERRLLVELPLLARRRFRLQRV